MSYGGEYLTKNEAEAYARLLRGLRPVTDVYVEKNDAIRRRWSVRVHWTVRGSGEKRARYLDSPDNVVGCIGDIRDGEMS